MRGAAATERPEGYVGGGGTPPPTFGARVRALLGVRGSGKTACDRLGARVEHQVAPRCVWVSGGSAGSVCASQTDLHITGRALPPGIERFRIDRIDPSRSY